MQSLVAELSLLLLNASTHGLAIQQHPYRHNQPEISICLVLGNACAVRVLLWHQYLQRYHQNRFYVSFFRLSFTKTQIVPETVMRV